MPKWRDTVVPMSTCPHCGHQMDIAGSPYGKSPRKGDFSVCIQCSGVAAFTRGLRLRRLTQSEQREAMLREDLQRFRKAVHEIPEDL